MSEFEKDALKCVRLYYDREILELQALVKYVHSVHRPNARWWKRFMIDVNAYFAAEGV